ncbi:serine hydrolase domain-containing protein [Microbulbifer epialgicus]|uniref:Serine hydrolase domain-containing protein n=1 Tax=Microbulbifer epialgicus TaxID=393907 RepID=A0ABV4P390_9GAMM
MHKTGFVAVILSVSLGLFSCDLRNQGSRSLGKILDPVLKEVISKHNIPAISVSVVSKGNAIYTGSAGIKQIGREALLSSKDLLHIGSNAKAFTPYLAAILVKEGKISWDTHISQVFPSISQSKIEQYEDASLSNLLSHRAWIKPMTAEGEFEDVPDYFMSPTLSSKEAMEAREKFVPYMLEFNPSLPANGKAYNYSNAGFIIAAAMLEQVANRPWEELVETYIFKPLNIEVVFGWPAAKNSNGVYGHLQSELGKLEPHDPNGEYKLPSIFAPAGDVSISTDDYTAWLQENLNCISGKSKILSKKTCHMLHFGSSDKKLFPMGWGRQKRDDGMLVSTHVGSAGTFLSYALIFEESNSAVAVTFNSANKDAELAFKDIYAVLKRELHL